MLLELPIKTVSEANSREHRLARYRRTAAQRREVWAEWKRAKVVVTLPVTIRLTRIGPNILDDDNLRSAFKGIRDEVAQLVGVDDGDPRIKFEYAQESVGKRQYAVRIEVVK